MLEWFADAGPVLQALIAATGTYLLTAVGTLPVLFFRSAPRRLMDAMMGFAGGVMVAASCWSLLTPGGRRRQKPAVARTRHLEKTVAFSVFFKDPLDLRAGSACWPAADSSTSPTSCCRISTASFQTRRRQKGRAWRGRVRRC